MALTYHRARWLKVTPTHQQYGIVARQRTSIGFKLAVRGDSGAGGLVAPLPCKAKLPNLGHFFTLELITSEHLELANSSYCTPVGLLLY